MGSPFVAFDWDGVLHKCRSYHPGPFADIDLSPVRMALANGWRVQIMTANDDMPGIATALRAAGIKAFVDHGLRYRDWDGGRDGQVVIISQRKMWTDFLVDDRAICYFYGTGTERLMAVLEESIKAKQQERELRKAGALR
jgi:hypothetical protein